MPKELGESVFAGSISIPKVSDGAGAGGDAVTLDGTGQVTPVTAAGDDIYGVLAEDSPAAGETVLVTVFGLAVGNVDGAVTDNDVLEPEGTTAGRLASNAQGSHQSVNEGGTATYTVALDHPRAKSDAGGEVTGADVTLGANEAIVFVKQ